MSNVISPLSEGQATEPEATNATKANDSVICFNRDEAAGLAVRVEDVMKIMTSLLDGAEDTIFPDDWKRKTVIIMARDRNRHLQYVIDRLRGLPIVEPINPRRDRGH